MSRLSILIGALFILVVSGGVYLFSQNFERVAEKKWVGPEPIVRQNPLLAAERFLRGMGIPAEGVDNLQALNELPPTDDVLVIDTARLTLQDDHYDRLFAWVQAGGHLIARTRPAEWDPDTEDWEFQGGPDPLIEHLGLTPDHGDYHEGPAEVPLRQDGEALKVEFDSWIHVGGAQPDDEVIESDNRTHLLHRKLGDGGITVTGGLDFISNWAIDEFDHAEFLWHLVHLEHTPGKVWLVHFDEMPSLGAWLWTHARPVVITLLILFLAWLAAATRRFGPLDPVPPPTRRRLLEHVEAAGHFLWRQGRRQALIADVRRALDARMCRLHPGWAELSTGERHRHLATLTNLGPQEIHELLHREDHAHPQDFTRLIKTLETIRKQL